MKTTPRLLALSFLTAILSCAQPAKPTPPASPEPSVITIEQPDAQRTREELNRLLEHYPPTLRKVFAADPTLLANPTYLAPYPALVGLLAAHPEIARSPSFYVGNSYDRPYMPENTTPAERVWERLVGDLGVFAGFGLAAGVLIWLIRTVIDYRRWNRLTKIQTDVHTKLLDRFTGNDELLAYIQSPAGSKFLESSPISLDAGPRSVAAPLGRILWSVQAGVVLLAGGVGLTAVSARIADEAAQPVHALGILAMALGLGFVVSAIISFVISRRLGLIEPASRVETPAPRG